jgi:hypothetical protein
MAPLYVEIPWYCIVCPLFAYCYRRVYIEVEQTNCMSIFHLFIADESVRSAFLTNLWYLCPNCSIEVPLSAEEEDALKRLSESTSTSPVLLNCPTCYLPCRAPKSLFI